MIKNNLSIIDHLLEYPSYCDSAETEQLFMTALKEELLFHAASNPRYAAFLRKKKFDVEKQFNLEELPFLPAQIFKTTTGLSTVAKDTITLALSSSATSGVPSIVPIDKITAKRQSKCMTKVMADFLGNKRRPFLIMDSDPKLASNYRDYGARGAALRAYLTFATKANYFMTEEKDRLIFNAKSFANAVVNIEEPVVLFGFTYVLYETVVQEALKMDKTFPLPQGSIILHIGGWKKLATAHISKERFTSDLESIFKVTKEKQIDVYGFTEQMGLNYPDCACGCKHTPNMSRVLVRDPQNHKILPDGQVGLLEFISPLPHSYPGCAILTDDLGVIVPGKCTAGRGGTRFKILGRQPKAEIRGCGDIMGEKLRKPIQEATHKEREGELRIFSWNSDSKNLPETISNVRKGEMWLRKQPVEAIGGLIDMVAATWMDNRELAPWKYKGLSFLCRWCSFPNLMALLHQSLRGMPRAVDEFIAEKTRPTHLLRALPIGVVAHWLSGNAPLLAMLVLVQSILAKNGNILKTAANNFDVLKTLLQTFSGTRYVTNNGYVITGDDLLSSIALVHYPHSDMISASKLSTSVDARIAWGGREAIDAICSLPSKAETVDIIFGPKTSFMVISREAIAEKDTAAKLLRRSATDISSFDQAACSSPHTIFVEEGGCLSPYEFAELLGSALANALNLIPKEPEDSATIAAIQNARAVGEFYGYCWHSDGPGWTVIYDDRKELARPVYSRTIVVRPVKNIMEVIPLIHNGIQTIGLAATGNKRLQFAEEAAGHGALRFPEIGSMTVFDSPWDGIFIMERLVKWISLGGTASVIARPRHKGGTNV